MKRKSEGYLSLTPDATPDGFSDLAHYISDLSEEAYSATWMDSIEYALWYRVIHGPGSYGRLDVTDEIIHSLRDLYERCGGWVRWDDDLNCCIFVPTGQWTKEFERWRNSGGNPEVWSRKRRPSNP